MTHRHRWAVACLALVAAIVASAAPALAQNATTLTADLGWSNAYRPGRWTPIFLTSTSPVPRQVIAEIYSPHSGASAMRIWKSYVIGPSATTHVIYIPLTQVHQLSETTVMLRDAATNKRLLEIAVPLTDPFSVNPSVAPIVADASMLFIGISGRTTTGGTLPSELGTRKIAHGYLPPLRLPDVALGYDGLDVLVLNAPDLEKIDPEQQRAIADWIRAGGCLLMWPGENPMASSGPIIDLLPCRFGDNQSLDIDPEKLKAAGLQPRFGKQRARELLPLPGAEPIQLFDGTVTGYTRSAGFGQVVVLPFDGMSLSFDDNHTSSMFWQPVMQAMVAIPAKPAENENTNNYAYNYGWQNDQRRNYALYNTLDWLGDIPGAGAFGFGYVAIMMLVLMAVVGPVDWFVLKRLGRQPWTWLTTGGWIGLVTLGAIYAGHVIKSGDLHFRSVRLLDQADGTTVATTDLLGIYSPRTTTYRMGFLPEAWMQPASDFQYGGRSRGLSDLVCHEDIRGSRPDGLRVNVWNLRFLEGQTRTALPPVIDATLSVKQAPDGPRVTGAIINRAGNPLTNVRIRTSAGVATYAENIAPNATAIIDLPLSGKPDALALPPQDANNGNQYYYNNYGYNNGSNVTSAAPDFKTLSMLESARSERLEQLLKTGLPKAVIYAELQNPSAPAALEAEGAIERHMALVRAVVHLE